MYSRCAKFETCQGGESWSCPDLYGRSENIGKTAQRQKRTSYIPSASGVLREVENQKYAYNHGALIRLILLASSYR